MTSIQMIEIEEIDVGARLRPAGEAAVEALAASIARAAEAKSGHEGLLSPISVRARPQGEEGRPYVLVAGYHRLMALRRLERQTIAAQVLGADAAEAELLEIEENLIRADLTVLDRALHVRAYRRIFEAFYGPITRGGDTKFSESSGQTAKLAVWSEAAKEKLGLAGRTLERLQKIARLDDVSIARLQVSDWANNQKFLEEFVGTPLADRPRILDLLLAPESRFSLREALAHLPAQAGQKPQEPKEEVWLRKALGVVGQERPKAWRRSFYQAAMLRDLKEFRAAVEANGYALTPRPLGDPQDEEA